MSKMKKTYIAPEFSFTEAELASSLLAVGSIQGQHVYSEESASTESAVLSRRRQNVWDDSDSDEEI